MGGDGSCVYIRITHSHYRAFIDTTIRQEDDLFVALEHKYKGIMTGSLCNAPMKFLDMAGRRPGMGHHHCGLRE